MTVVLDECWFCEEDIERDDETWCTADGYDAHKWCWESAADSSDLWIKNTIVTYPLRR
jgi:hypothetical protein